MFVYRPSGQEFAVPARSPDATPDLAPAQNRQCALAPLLEDDSLSLAAFASSASEQSATSAAPKPVLVSAPPSSVYAKL